MKHLLLNHTLDSLQKHEVSFVQMQVGYIC